MQKEKDLKALLGDWKDKDVKKKFKGQHDHKFLDRNRTLKINWSRLHAYAKDYVLSDSPLKILDVASGNGATLEIFRHYGHKVAGLDFSPGFEKNDWLYKPLIESQGLPVKVHDCSIVPYPHKDKEFDFLVCYGAITFFKPVEKWPNILNEFARLSKHGFLVGVNVGNVYDAGKKFIENWKHPEFELDLNSGSIYRWKKK